MGRRATRRSDALPQSRGHVHAAGPAGGVVGVVRGALRAGHLASQAAGNVCRRRDSEGDYRIVAAVCTKQPEQTVFTQVRRLAHLAIWERRRAVLARPCLRRRCMRGAVRGAELCQRTVRVQGGLWRLQGCRAHACARDGRLSPPGYWSGAPRGDGDVEPLPRGQREVGCGLRRCVLVRRPRRRALLFTQRNRGNDARSWPVVPARGRRSDGADVGVPSRQRRRYGARRASRARGYGKSNAWHTCCAQRVVVGILRNAKTIFAKRGSDSCLSSIAFCYG